MSGITTAGDIAKEPLPGLMILTFTPLPTVGKGVGIPFKRVPDWQEWFEYGSIGGTKLNFAISPRSVKKPSGTERVDGKPVNIG